MTKNDHCIGELPIEIFERAMKLPVKNEYAFASAKSMAAIRAEYEDYVDGKRTKR